MDRVGFLLESTGARLGCLLNPETLEISRLAGVRPRQSAGGLLTLRGLRDDPLHFTGGGTTELKMDLLFDIGLAGSSIAAQDARDLTAPLWQLAENSVAEDGIGRLPLARFVWGKAWNIPGVVAAISERFEDFTAEGVPRRSWVRMRFLRVEEPAALTPTDGSSSTAAEAALPPDELPTVDQLAHEDLAAHEVVGGPTDENGPAPAGLRLDALAQRSYGNAALWRWIAAFNNLDDPLHIPTGRVVLIPPLERKNRP